MEIKIEENRTIEAKSVQRKNAAMGRRYKIAFYNYSGDISSSFPVLLYFRI